jgi:hypothetical protein
MFPFLFNLSSFPLLKQDETLIYCVTLESWEVDGDTSIHW